MISGGPSVRPATAPKSFDFWSDDLLRSFNDDSPDSDPSTDGKHSDPSAKDFYDSRVRSSSANLHAQFEKFRREDVIYAVEKCMEKCADNIMMYLEGISGRLIQLELYCCKLEQSMGELRPEIIRQHSEGELKLKSLEKHVYEIHRSIQIIRDKQELSEAQEELAKLSFSQQDSADSTQLQKTIDVPNQQFPLSLPHQLPSAPDQNHPFKELPLQHQPAHLPLLLLPQNHYVLNQQQTQNLQPDLYHTHQNSQMSNLSARQHWIQPMQQPQQASSQCRAPIFHPPPPYALVQPAGNTIPESCRGCSILPAPYSTISLPPSQGYVGTSLLGNPVYFIGGSAASHLQSHRQGSCSPAGDAAAPVSSNDCRFEDMVEKAVAMGYPRDQVVGALCQIRIAEGGRPP